MTSKSRRGSGEGGIHKRVDGRWEARIDLGWVNGKRKRPSVYGKTRREVAEKLRLRQNDKANNALIVDERLTVERWLDHWVEVVLPNRVANGTLSASTYHNYADTVRLHLNPGLGKIRLSRLKATDIDRFIASKRDAYSGNSLRIMRTSLHKAFRDGERAEIVPHSAVIAVELSESVRVSRRASEFLSMEQARLLLDGVRGDRLEAIYVVLLSLGLRRGEALGLFWEDIDFENRVITVRRSLKRVQVLPNQTEPGNRSTRLELGSTKTAGSWRNQVLPQPCVDALQQHRVMQAAERLAAPVWADSRLVFTTPIGTMIDPANLAKEFSAHTKRAGLGHRNLHQLRHSAATIMLVQGVPLNDVSRVLGHTTISVTSDVYGHFTAERARVAADAMGDALWGESVAIRRDKCISETKGSVSILTTKLTTKRMDQSEYQRTATNTR